MIARRALLHAGRGTSSAAWSLALVVIAGFSLAGIWTLVLRGFPASVVSGEIASPGTILAALLTALRVSLLHSGHVCARGLDDLSGRQRRPLLGCYAGSSCPFWRAPSVAAHVSPLGAG